MRWKFFCTQRSQTAPESPSPRPGWKWVAEFKRQFGIGDARNLSIVLPIAAGLLLRLDVVLTACTACQCNGIGASDAKEAVCSQRSGQKRMP